MTGWAYFVCLVPDFCEGCMFKYGNCERTKKIKYYEYLRQILRVFTTFQINQPTRCNNFSSLLLDVYSYVSSTCFGRPHAHRQELNNCSSSLWFYRCSVVVAVLLVVVGPIGRPDHDQQHCYHHAPKVKPEAFTAVVELLMMGVRTPETC
jgi:hypothetical protein